jgi:hypothetical protein
MVVEGTQQLPEPDVDNPTRLPELEHPLLRRRRIKVQEVGWRLVEHPHPEGVEQGLPPTSLQIPEHQCICGCTGSGMNTHPDLAAPILLMQVSGLVPRRRHLLRCRAESELVIGSRKFALDRCLEVARRNDLTRSCLQDRHVGIEVDPVQALDVQRHMPVQHIIYRYDPRHDDHLPQPFLVAMMRSPAPIRLPGLCS